MTFQTPGNTREGIEPGTGRWALALPAMALAFGYAMVAVQIGHGLFPAAHVAWWLIPLIVVSVWIGTFIPWLQTGFGIVLGRFVTGGFLFFVPSIIEAVASLTRAGWSVEQFLLQGVLPGMYVMSGYVLATQMGELLSAFHAPVGEGDTSPEAMARRSITARRQLLRLLLKAWLLLAVVNTLIAEALPAGVYRPGLRLMAMFLALGLVATLALLVLTHGRVLHFHWLAHGPLAHTAKRSRSWWRQSAPVFMLPVLAAVFPADVSPVARAGVGGFFSNVSERLAPLFVASARTQRPPRGPGWFHSLLARWGFFEPDAGVDATVLDGPVNAVLTLLLAGAALAAIGMLYRWRRKPGPHDERSGPVRGKESVWRELWRWLLNMWRGLFGSLADFTGSGGSGREKLKRGPGGRAKRKGRQRLSADPARRVRQLFAALLVKLGRAGYPRQGTETPHEYARRVAQTRPDVANDLADATAAYVAVRYGHDQSVSLLERAYATIQRAGNHVLRFIRRKSEDRQSTN